MWEVGKVLSKRSQEVGVWDGCHDDSAIGLIEANEVRVRLWEDGRLVGWWECEQSPCAYLARDRREKTRAMETTTATGRSWSWVTRESRQTFHTSRCFNTIIVHPRNIPTSKSKFVKFSWVKTNQGKFRIENSINKTLKIQWNKARLQNRRAKNLKR